MIQMHYTDEHPRTWKDAVAEVDKAITAHLAAPHDTFYVLFSGVTEILRASQAIRCRVLPCTAICLFNDSDPALPFDEDGELVKQWKHDALFDVHGELLFCDYAEPIRNRHTGV